MKMKEWLECTEPKKMLRFARRKVNDRKLRLFACGCCRRVWKDLSLKPVRQAVEAAEQFANETLTAQELQHKHAKGVLAFTKTFPRNFAKMQEDSSYAIKMYRMALAVNVAHDPPFQISQLDRLDKDEFLKALSPSLLRCVVGNPFRPLTADSKWLTWKDGTVVQLAQVIYDECAFDRLPILADALEEAGCTNTDILNHCRQPGEHVRGCWVIDLLLGKE
jgi:hypothetical protein